jgi:hypothetical protein
MIIFQLKPNDCLPIIREFRKELGEVGIAGFY